MALSCVSWLGYNHACQIDSYMLGGELSVTNARDRMATPILPEVVYLTEALTSILYSPWEVQIYAGSV